MRPQHSTNVQAPALNDSRYSDLYVVTRRVGKLTFLNRFKKQNVILCNALILSHVTPSVSDVQGQIDFS